MARDRKNERRLMKAIAESTQDRPNLPLWLERMTALQDDGLSEAVAGIYCGAEGGIHVAVPGSGQYLRMTWYNGRVEVAYLS